MSKLGYFIYRDWVMSQTGNSFKYGKAYRVELG